jgi:hypothetical protein
MPTRPSQLENMRCNEGGPAYAYPPLTKNMRCNEGGLAYAYPLPLKNMRYNEEVRHMPTPPTKKHEM